MIFRRVQSAFLHNGGYAESGIAAIGEIPFLIADICTLGFLRYLLDDFRRQRKKHREVSDLLA